MFPQPGQLYLLGFHLPEGFVKEQRQLETGTVQGEQVGKESCGGRGSLNFMSANRLLQTFNKSSENCHYCSGEVLKLPH